MQKGDIHCEGRERERERDREERMIDRAL